MRFKLILFVVITAIWCVGCNDEDVDTTYRINAENPEVTITKKEGAAEDGRERLLINLNEKSLIGEILLTGDSRAENNKEAKLRFEGKYATIQELDLDQIFALQPGDSIVVSFLYTLTRGDECIDYKEVRMNEAVPVISDLSDK